MMTPHDRWLEPEDDDEIESPEQRREREKREFDDVDPE